MEVWRRIAESELRARNRCNRRKRTEGEPTETAKRASACDDVHSSPSLLGIVKTINVSNEYKIAPAREGGLRGRSGAKALRRGFNRPPLARHSSRNQHQPVYTMFGANAR